MEAPKHIYLHRSKHGEIPSLHSEEPVNLDGWQDIKYIRADLANLTWEDVRELCSLSFAVEVDLGREISDKQHYSEVLRRFNSQRAKK